MYSHVIWDWNGTLLDDLDICLSVINDILSARSLKTLDSVAEYQEKFCFPISKYYKNLGFDFSVESFDSLADEYMRTYDVLSTQSPLFSGAESVLKEVGEMGIAQVILSASEYGRLTAQLTQRNVLHYFEDRVGLNDHYAVTKVDAGRRWLSLQNGAVKKGLMVGDTTHDFEVAQALAFDCVLVSTGHQSESILEATGCPVVEGVSDVLKYL